MDDKARHALDLGDPWGYGTLPAQNGPPPFRRPFVAPPWSDYWADIGGLAKLIWPAATSFAIDAYEYSLYGLAFHQIKATFFHGSSELSWLCYAAPFFTRPFGGTVSGWLADNYGRRLVVVATSYAVLFATVLQGCIPSGFGYFGAVLLLLLRFVQGFAFGATSSFSVYAVEVAPQATLCQGVMLLGLGGLLGGLASSGGFTLLEYALTPEDMYGWGWRVPYLVVFLPGIWSAANTHRLQEAPEYTPPPAEGCGAGGQGVARWGVGRSLKVIFAESGFNTLMLAGVYMAGTALNYVTRAYMMEWLPTYAGVSPAYATALVFLNSAVCLVCTPFVTYATDAYGASRLLLAGSAVVAACSVAAFALLQQGPQPRVAGVALQVFYGAAMSLGTPTVVFALGLLPTHVRSMGLGLVGNLMTCFFGGLSPAVLTLLCQYTPLAPAYYLTAVHLACLAAVAAATACHRRGFKVSYLREAPF